MVTRSSPAPSWERHPPHQHEDLLREDEMGDSVAQTVLLTSLGAVLAHLYRATGWFVARLQGSAVLRRADGGTARLSSALTRRA